MDCWKMKALRANRPNSHVILACSNLVNLSTYVCQGNWPPFSSPNNAKSITPSSPELLSVYLPHLAKTNLCLPGSFMVGKRETSDPAAVLQHQRDSVDGWMDVVDIGGLFRPAEKKQKMATG